MGKNSKERSFLKIVLKIISLAYIAAPLCFIINNLLGVLHGVSLTFNIFITQKFFDSVDGLVRADGRAEQVLLIALGLGSALILNQILNGVHNFTSTILYTKVVGYIGVMINRKSGKLDALAFENPSNLDDISKAKEGMETCMNLYFATASLLTFYFPYFLSVGIYLYFLEPILVLSLVMIFLPVALTQLIRVKIFTKLADESAPIRREYEYYEKCITDREYFKETRLLGAVGYFKHLYISSLKLLNKKIWIAQKKSGIIEVGMKLITLVGYMGTLYLLSKALINGKISVGAFGAVFSSIGLMFSLMEEIICIHIGNLTSSLGSIKNLLRFLEMDERKGEDILIEGIPDIVLKNVSFMYPGADNKSLNNINLEIKSGETIAIVGENGAGKTTLVNLMTGLYLPSEGEVMFNGINTKNISMDSLYKSISGVFQKFQKYKLTLGENIAISDLKEISKQNRELLDKAKEKADLVVSEEKFGDGYNTMLSREFDGIDLSGGQWQRIAIARGFYRSHNVIVLDEPTAAIDPVEETKIYKKFAEMSQDKTAIIVTHRLGSAKIANRIIVMDKGEIAQVGTHEELMMIDGKYAEMYEAQSKWYAQEVVV